MNRLTSVAFTGHRNYNGSADEALKALIRNLYEEGYRRFLSGMAVGFDLSAAEAVVELRAELSGLQLVAVVPFDGQQMRFSRRDCARYEQLLELADERITLASHYHAGCYQVRNNYLIDHSSLLIAWYNGDGGGTQYTFLRALHLGLPIKNLGTVGIDPTLF